MPYGERIRVAAVAIVTTWLSVACVATGNQELLSAEIVKLSSGISVDEETLYSVDGARTEKFDVCFGEDGDRIAFARKTSDSWTVTLDGVSGGAFDELFYGTSAFSLMPGFIDDCENYVYVGRVDDAWHWMVNNESRIILDEKPRRENFVGRSYIEYYEGRAEFTEDAYIVDEDRERYVIADGKELKRYHVGSAGGIFAKSVVFLCAAGQTDCEFERDGPIPPVFRDEARNRVAYRVNENDDLYFVVDEVEYGPYQRLNEDLTQIRFSPDGQHFAFVGRRDSRSILNIDGVDSVSSIAFQFNAAHSAFPFRFTDSNTIRTYAIRNGNLARLTVSIPP